MTAQYDWRDLVNTSTDDEAPEHRLQHSMRRNEHRPTQREVLLREILRLRAQGLRVRDVAEALGMNPSAVEALIYGDEPGSGSV